MIVVGKFTESQITAQHERIAVLEAKRETVQRNHDERAEARDAGINVVTACRIDEALADAKFIDIVTMYGHATEAHRRAVIAHRRCRSRHTMGPSKRAVELAQVLYAACDKAEVAKAQAYAACKARGIDWCEYALRDRPVAWLREHAASLREQCDPKDYAAQAQARAAERDTEQARLSLMESNLLTWQDARDIALNLTRDDIIALYRANGWASSVPILSVPRLRDQHLVINSRWFEPVNARVRGVALRTPIGDAVKLWLEAGGINDNGLPRMLETAAWVREGFSANSRHRQRYIDIFEHALHEAMVHGDDPAVMYATEDIKSSDGTTVRFRSVRTRKAACALRTLDPSHIEWRVIQRPAPDIRPGATYADEAAFAEHVAEERARRAEEENATPAPIVTCVGSGVPLTENPRYAK